MQRQRRRWATGVAGLLGGVLAGLAGNAGYGQEADAMARAFIREYEAEIRPLEIETNLAWWNANTTGRDEDYAAKEEAENRLDRALARRDRFERLEAIREMGVEDPLLARQIHVLYLTYLSRQLDPALLERITAKANTIEKSFNVYRAEVGGHLFSDSEVRRVLSESEDPAHRQAVWEASKGVGAEVEDELRELVLLRNEAARRLGFSDFHAMQLYLNEQDQQEVLALFDELDELTREPFRQVKADVDAQLADGYGIEVADLRPWHYHDPFFQEPPNVFETDLDEVFAEVDIVDLCRDFYDGIGLPIDEVIANSDLYEKPGKSPHAFCTDIDRAGDVRVLANIVPNEYWTSTMLHELGHAVYSSRYIPQSMPYTLRTDAHILTTEGVAMMFERFAKSGDWLVEMGVDVPDREAYNRAAGLKRRNQLLIFSRWCQVMLRFEVAMYRDPGQDLNRLWWELVHEYQGVTPPEGRDAPDYASKIHVVSAPAYYHNYMMGELFACQLHRTIAREVLESDRPTTAIYTRDPRVGAFMQERVFDPGRSLPWNELTRHATGEPLGAAAFAAEFSSR